MQYKNSYKKLKINEKDFKILACLFKYENTIHTLFPTFISASTKIPRTTVEFRLKELKSRQFCSDKKCGRERIWEISNIGKSMLLEQDRKESNIENIFGMDSIYNYLVNLFSKIGVDRIYVIEPASQTTTYFQKNLHTTDSQIKVSGLFKQYQHISEVIMSETTFKHLQTFSKKVLLTILGRHTFMTVAPDENISFKDYIVCYLGQTLFMDFKNEKCVIVHDSNFTESIISIIKNLQIFGRKINLDQEIRKILKSRESNV